MVGANAVVIAYGEIRAEGAGIGPRVVLIHLMWELFWVLVLVFGFGLV